MIIHNRDQRERSGGAEPAGEGGPAGPELRLLREFLRRLLGYVKSRKLYPPGHARPVAQLDAWHRAAVEILAAVPELTLYVEPDALIIAGRRLDDREPFAAELTAEFIRRLVRHVAAAPGVRAEDLAAVADILLLDPAELKARGGAAAVIAGANAAAITVMEFSYDMQRYVEDPSDVELVRTLARCNAAGKPEEVLGKFAEQRVSADERRLLKELLADGAIREKLGALGALVGGSDAAAEGVRATTQVRASDVLLLLVRELGAASADGAELTLPRKAQIAALLDRMKTDLASAAVRAAVASQEQTLSTVATTLFGSRDAVRHWLSDSRSVRTQNGEGSAEALRAIFSRTGGAARSIRLGTSVMTTLEVPGAAPAAAPAAAPGMTPAAPPGKAPAAAPPAKRAGVPPDATIADVVRGLAALTEKCNGAMLRLDPAKVKLGHRDTLLALVEREQDAAARDGIGRRLAAFLNRNLESDAQEGAALMTGVTEAGGMMLRDSDRTILAEEPAVCTWALGRLIDANEMVWYVALRAVAKRARAVFAQAFGTLLLTRSAEMPEARLQEFCPLCDEDLCRFLAMKVAAETRSGRLERIVGCVLACGSPAAVDAIERLFPRVGSDARHRLITRLIEIDNREALRVLSCELATADLHVRVTIIKMLGYSTNTMAEEILADQLRGGRAGKADIEEQQACLGSLRRLGTARCLDVVRAISGDWRLFFSAKGRELRAQARSVAETVQARLTQRPRLSEEERNAQ